MIYISKFRSNDLNPSRGKQIEFNKGVVESFFNFTNEEHAVEFECHSILDTELKEKIRVEFKLSPARGDYKIYQNRDGSRDLKDFLLDTLHLRIEKNINDYFAIKKQSPIKYLLYYIPKDSLFSHFFSIASNDQVLFIPDEKEIETLDNRHQVIYYGSPGTGKSHTINRETKGHKTFRTTFHPDTDYASFVGCYKPMAEGHNGNYRFKSLQDLKAEANIINRSSGDKVSQIVAFVTKYANDLQYIVDTDPNIKSLQNLLNKNLSFANETYLAYVVDYVLKNQETRITYKFCPQVFTNAYIKAWEDTSKPVYLIIEEINRGNCAQIFGDLFQLLDRDKETGKSEYPIKADKDLVAHIEKVLGAGHEGIKNGELCLPPNLIIYATMNTSDQSLFPMDSAFKRRWDWEYVPINYSKDIDSGKFIIEIDEHIKYSWVEFLESVNDKIYDATNSEDKQMGNFFIKKSIKANEFVNKVMFYLWNEVCKEEYGTQRNFFRKGKEGKTEFKFTELFGDNQATILKEFMTSLGVEPIGKKPEEPAAE